MKVEIISAVAGPQGVYNPGEIHTLDMKTAKALINAGAAIPIRKTTKTATRKQTEKAVTR